MLASEPVGGRSRATELPCFVYFGFIEIVFDNLKTDGNESKGHI